MKIKNQQINNFLLKPFDYVSYVLFYGTEGVIRDHFRILANSIVPDLQDAFRVVNLFYDQVVREPSLLSDEMQAISMFGGQKLIVVNNVTSDINATLKQIIIESQSDNICIFIANELSPNSKVRQLFEKGNHTIAIPCYLDDYSSIIRIIRNYFQSKNIKIASQAVEYIANLVNSDRTILYNELDKIVIYHIGKRVLSLQDVEICFSESDAVNITSIVNSFAELSLSNFDKHLNNALVSGISIMQIIYAINNYFTKILIIKNMMLNQNITFELAIKQYKPAIFFKEIPFLKKHTANWSMQQLIGVIHVIGTAELECKLRNSDSFLLQLVTEFIARTKFM